jgi:putative protease
VKGHTTDFTQTIASMQINHQQVNEVKKGQEIGIQVKGKVRHKDKVYKVG